MTHITGTTGNIQEVNDDRQALTRSVVETDLEYASEKNGEGYVWNSSFTTGTTGVEVIYIKNASTTKNLVIDKVIAGASGATIYTIFEVTSGTAAGTSLTAQNLNLSSGKSASDTSFGNAAVTGSLTGNNLFYLPVVANDSETLELDGSLILGQDNEIAVACSANVTAYISVIGHYKDID